MSDSELKILRRAHVIRASLTASGRFMARINLPFQPSHVIVKTIGMSNDNGLFVLRCNWTQSGILGIMDGAGIQPHHNILRISNVGMTGDYEIQCVNADGALVTTMNGHKIMLYLEFIKV